MISPGLLRIFQFIFRLIPQSLVRKFSRVLMLRTLTLTESRASRGSHRIKPGLSPLIRSWPRKLLWKYQVLKSVIERSFLEIAKTVWL